MPKPNRNNQGARIQEHVASLERQNHAFKDILVALLKREGRIVVTKDELKGLPPRAGITFNETEDQVVLEYREDVTDKEAAAKREPGIIVPS